MVIYFKIALFDKWIYLYSLGFKNMPCTSFAPYEQTSRRVSLRYFRDTYIEINFFKKTLEKFKKQRM